jgi:hypothetical protein
MSALVISAIVFACVFGGALFGMFLGTVLPKDHLSPDARDVIKVTMRRSSPISLCCQNHAARSVISLASRQASRVRW